MKKTSIKQLSDEYMKMVASSYNEVTMQDDFDGNNTDVINELAAEYKTSTVRIRKILITAGVYRTARVDEIIKLRNENKSVNEISKITGIKPAAVRASLPYSKKPYNIDPKTELGDRVDLSRKRKKAVTKLTKNIAGPDTDFHACNELLWECVVLFQNYHFHTSGRGGKGGVSFRYKLKKSSVTGNVTDEIVIDRKEKSKTITRSTVELAFKNAIFIQNKEGYVKGPKKLGCFGASYLYSMFIRFGIITDNNTGVAV